MKAQLFCSQQDDATPMHLFHFFLYYTKLAAYCTEHWDGDVFFFGIHSAHLLVSKPFLLFHLKMDLAYQDPRCYGYYHLAATIVT